MKQQEQEFVGLIQQYRGIIYKIASFYADETQSMEDLYQEIVLNLWKAFPKFRKEASPSTWIYKIAINTCISFFRRKKRRPPLSKITFDIAEESEDKELITKLYDTINQLGKMERALILLYLEDKSYKEISEITGLTLTNVATKLSRLKLKLSEMFND